MFGLFLIWAMAAQATAMAATTVAVGSVILPPADSRSVTSLSSPGWDERGSERD